MAEAEVSAKTTGQKFVTCYVYGIWGEVIKMWNMEGSTLACPRAHVMKVL